MNLTYILTLLYGWLADRWGRLAPGVLLGAYLMFRLNDQPEQAVVTVLLIAFVANEWRSWKDRMDLVDSQREALKCLRTAHAAYTDAAAARANDLLGHIGVSATRITEMKEGIAILQADLEKEQRKSAEMEAGLLEANRLLLSELETWRTKFTTEHLAHVADLNEAKRDTTDLIERHQAVLSALTHSMAASELRAMALLSTAFPTAMRRENFLGEMVDYLYMELGGVQVRFAISKYMREYLTPALEYFLNNLPEYDKAWDGHLPTMVPDRIDTFIVDNLDAPSTKSVTTTARATKARGKRRGG